MLSSAQHPDCVCVRTTCTPRAIATGTRPHECCVPIHVLYVELRASQSTENLRAQTIVETISHPMARKPLHIAALPLASPTANCDYKRVNGRRKTLRKNLIRNHRRLARHSRNLCTVRPTLFILQDRWRPLVPVDTHAQHLSHPFENVAVRRTLGGQLASHRSCAQAVRRSRPSMHESSRHVALRRNKVPY